MRRSRWAILWAVVLILGGALLLAQNLRILGNFDAPILTLLLGSLGILFVLDFVTTGAGDWWAIIPGSILLGVAGAIYLGVREVKGEWAGSLMLFSIGLPFLLIYLAKRGEFWWALIPGGILTLLAIIPLLTLGVPGEAIGSLVLWLIALPFLFVFFTSRQNWWALIPGGTLLVLGLMPLLALAHLPTMLISGIFFFGLAAVFGLLYVLHLRQPEMAWAIYPAVALLAVGVGVVAFGQNWWPLILIGVGIVLLIRAVLPRRG